MLLRYRNVCVHFLSFSLRFNPFLNRNNDSNDRERRCSASSHRNPLTPSEESPAPSLGRDRQRLTALFFPNSSAPGSNSDSRKNNRSARLSLLLIRLQGLEKPKENQSILAILYDILGLRLSENPQILVRTHYRSSGSSWDSHRRA